MSTQTIDTGVTDCLARDEDGIAVITLNRPEARNALSADMIAGLQYALDYAERTPEIRCVVITGTGGAFCAGGDVKGMSTDNTGDTAGPSLDERIHTQRLKQHNTSGRMYTMPKPVLASLPGPAAGAGLSLALAADLRIMADTAFITTAFAKVGYSGDYGGTYFLSRLIGQGKARELYFLSDRVSAEECLQLGIANKVVPAGDLEQETLALARRLAEGPPVAYRYMKENFRRAAAAADLFDCLDLEATHHNHTGLTEDHHEAVKAFLEKRPPTFEGR